MKREREQPQDSDKAAKKIKLAVEFPLDIVSLLPNFLPPSSIASFVRVSKAFASVITPQFWGNYYLNYFHVKFPIPNHNYAHHMRVRHSRYKRVYYPTILSKPIVLPNPTYSIPSTTISILNHLHTEIELIEEQAKFWQKVETMPPRFTWEKEYLVPLNVMLIKVEKYDHPDGYHRDYEIVFYGLDGLPNVLKLSVVSRDYDSFFSSCNNVPIYQEGVNVDKTLCDFCKLFGAPKNVSFNVACLFFTRVTLFTGRNIAELEGIDDVE